jgi:hypothetical protein
LRWHARCSAAVAQEEIMTTTQTKLSSHTVWLFAVGSIAAGVVGCKKHEDSPAGTPSTGSAAAPTVAAKPAARAALASTVKYVDPEFVITNKPQTFDFTGTPQVHVYQQPDGDYTYELRMFPPGAKVDCDFDVTFAKALPGESALVVDLGRNESAPKAGLELTGSYSLHFTSPTSKSPTTNGVREGAKVKLTAIAGKTASGELDAKADGDNQPTAKGTFTAQLCGWPEDEGDGAESSDGGGADGSE